MIKVKAHKTNKWAYSVEIKDKTTRLLANGVRVATALNMARKAAKI